ALRTAVIATTCAGGATTGTGSARSCLSCGTAWQPSGSALRRSSWTQTAFTGSGSDACGGRSKASKATRRTRRRRNWTPVTERCSGRWPTRPGAIRRTESMRMRKAAHAAHFWLAKRPEASTYAAERLEWCNGVFWLYHSDQPAGRWVERKDVGLWQFVPTYA